MALLTSLSKEHRAALASNPWFADLPRAVQDSVVARARRRNLAPGEQLFSRGDRSVGVYGVLAGVVRVSGVSLGGRETVLDFYGPGSWIGEVSTIEGQPRQHDAHAHGTASLLQVSPDDLEALLAMHPALSRAFLRLEARRLRIVLTALEQYSVQSLEQRLANRLLMLAGPHGAASPEGVKIRLRFSQDTLAQLIGCARQRVNQILRRWERDGVVEHRYGHITLLEQVKLEKLTQS